MAKTATCPSCGAPVVFKSPASAFAVCEFCRSTLLRDGEALKNLGRMAELLDDPTRLRIGSAGVHERRRFAVIGRIQLRHASGLWNEWHVLFDDGRSAWLSEAGGEYVLSVLTVAKEPLPAFADLSPETSVLLNGRTFKVADLETARCVAGEGELPFRVESGYDVKTADLRSGERFATIDYSETPPLLFVGKPVTFTALKLSGLREHPAHQENGRAGTQVRVFNCPKCGGPLQAHSPAIERVVCAGCGAVIGTENESVRLLAQAARAKRVEPRLPLGCHGTLQGIEWETIGFLQRRTRSDGVDYAWSEYLLFSAEHGFAWLTEYDGHWNFARTLSAPPSVARGQPLFWNKGGRFKLFNSGTAEVAYVVGEFYWRVAVGEKCSIDDYVCPPFMLSREMTPNEVVWSESEYLEPETVGAAFGVAMPSRVGVYANQPNPWAATAKKSLSVFLGLCGVATLVQLAFALFLSSQTVLKQPLVLSSFNEDATLTTRTFSMPNRARALRVRHRTDVNNSWVDVTTTLVEKNSGEAREGAVEVAYYSGSEGGENWSEGSQDESIGFKDVPAGEYYLTVEYELGREQNARRAYSVVDNIEVVRNPITWSNYVLVILFLAIFPVFARWRYSAFEERRWREADLGDAVSVDSGDDDGEEDE